MYKVLCNILNLFCGNAAGGSFRNRSHLFLIAFELHSFLIRVTSLIRTLVASGAARFRDPSLVASGAARFRDPTPTDETWVFLHILCLVGGSLFPPMFPAGRSITRPTAVDAVRLGIFVLFITFPSAMFLSMSDLQSLLLKTAGTLPDSSSTLKVDVVFCEKSLRYWTVWSRPQSK